MDNPPTHNPARNPVLAYLEAMPGYPYDPDVDSDFVDELLEDFQSVNLLEQVKAFRWHHDGHPARHFRSLRPAIRRWLASSGRRPTEPF